MLNENHLFEALGLTQTTEEELEELFEENITHFIKTEIFLSKKKD